MKEIRHQLGEIATRYGIQAVYAFGSRAEETARLVRGEATTARAGATGTSDADIGVLPARGTRHRIDDKVRIAEEMEDLFRVGRVDLVSLPEASAFLALEVVRGELIYDADPDSTALYELYVLRRAGDLFPFERQRREFLLAGGGG